MVNVRVRFMNIDNVLFNGALKMSQNGGTKNALKTASSRHWTPEKINLKSINLWVLITWISIALL